MAAQLEIEEINVVKSGEQMHISCRSNPYSIFAGSILLIAVSAMLSGCAGNDRRGTSGWTTPAQHATSQVQWLKSRAGQLTPEELYLLQRVPWRSDGTADGDRQKIFDLARDGEAPVNRFTRQRVLGRPRVMDVALEELRARQLRERPATTKPTDSRSELDVENDETNSRGTESTSATTGVPGEDGGRR